MQDLDFETFDQIMDESLDQLSEDLNMSDIGAAVNQLFHLLHFLSSIDPVATTTMITAAKDHLTDQISSDELGQKIVILIEDLHASDDAQSGKTLLH